MEESKLRSDGKAAPDKIEPRKPADVIMKQQVEAGLGELHRSTMGLLITGLAAGLELGFSLFFMAVMLTYEQGALPRPIHEFLLAHMYTIGFIFVIVGRSELFTEHTTTAVMPVLHGQASIRQLARLWGLIYVANLVGEAIFSGIAVLAGPSLGVIDPNAFSVLASRVVNHSWWVILLSAILAGWLMGLLAWLVTAARDTISQVIVIWLVISVIGFSHLHHVISGTGEVLSGLFAGQGISWGDFGHFLLWATLGNSIGGVVFVAALKHGYAREENKDQPPSEEQGSASKE